MLVEPHISAGGTPAQLRPRPLFIVGKYVPLGCEETQKNDNPAGAFLAYPAKR